MRHAVEYRRTWRWKRTPTEKRYSAVAVWEELWKPNLKAILVCSWRGHDLQTKFGGVRVCRRCS
jgi:hypothetical protein